MLVCAACWARSPGAAPIGSPPSNDPSPRVAATAPPAAETASQAIDGAIARAGDERDAGNVSSALLALDDAMKLASADPAAQARIRIHRARLNVDAFELERAADELRAAGAIAGTRTMPAPLDWLARSLAIRIAAPHEAASVSLDARRRLHDRAGFDPADAAESALFAASDAVRAGEPDEARAWLERAERLRPLSGGASMLRSLAVLTRAEIEAASGQLSPAIDRLRSELTHVVASRGPDGLDYARLALRYGYEASPAHPVEARAALLSALSWFQRSLGDRNRLTLAARESLAYVASQLGRFDEAIAHQEEVVRARTDRDGASARATLAARHLLANALSRAGRHAEQRTVLTSALADANASLGALSPEALHMNVELASAHWAVGRRDEACDLADWIDDSAGPRLDDAIRVEVDYVRASCQRWQGRFAPAIAAFQRNIEARSRLYGGDVVGAMNDRAALARALIDAGAYGAAIVELEALNTFAEDLRSRELPGAPGGRTAFAWWGRSLDDEAGYRDLAWLYARAGRTTDAVRSAESGRARSVNDALDLRVAAAGLPDRSRVALARLTAQLRDVEARLALERPGSSAHVRLELERKALVEGVRSSTVSAADEKRSVRGWAEAAALLPPDAAFVGFQIVYGGVWAYVVRGGSVRIVMLDQAMPLLRAVPALRGVLESPYGDRLRLWRLVDGRYTAGLSPPERDAREIPRETLLAALRRALIDPLLRVARPARRWIVAPDGVLASLPLDILFDASDPVARNGVQYASSLVAWAAAQRLGDGRRRSDLDIVAIGGVDYPPDIAAAPGPLAPRRWSPLPAAAREIDEVVAPFAASRRVVIVGRDATKDRVEQLSREGVLSRARFVHVSAHAYLAASAPQWSSIVLAGDSRSRFGFLTAAELASLELTADLVTLSACETAVGETIAGEGVFGLPYALSVAGARSTLLTLWPVADESTAEFMKRFYAKLASGVRPSVALAATKREFMRHPRWNAPFYWAPFVLYGALD